MRVGGRYLHGGSAVNPGAGMSFGYAVPGGMIYVMLHQRDTWRRQRMKRREGRKKYLIDTPESGATPLQGNAGSFLLRPHLRELCRLPLRGLPDRQSHEGCSWASLHGLPVSGWMPIRGSRCTCC